jgi:protein SCO1
VAEAGSCRTTLLALLALLAASALAVGMPARSEEAAPQPSLDARAALRASQAAVGRRLADFTLLDREGRPVRLSDYRGKPLLVNFIYTGCFQVCPTSTRALSEALGAMGGSFDATQFNVVSIGFNQPADSPQAMKAFAQQHRIAAPNWDFLSAPAAIVEPLTRQFGFVYVPTQAGFEHLLQVGIVDANGRLVAQVYGDDFSADRLGEPLRRLLTDQPLPAQSSLADILDKVRVLCSVYDPISGTYRVSYALAIEVAGGIIFVVAILGFFALEWRERRRLRRLR